ncbi:rab GTPase-binding effector protein 1-like isoform X2 [Portunus trituberculatus]|uniref:rab GTPase-binding effector protein 1-like isoform X2 n=1 Tax=Portunus trituberculatus TaxID=210409 RepID=UPI001E1CCCAC|nr:rab GTPase-binding effector protein 1-like isoform X2 [Portunus trituberculatus]
MDTEVTPATMEGDGGGGDPVIDELQKKIQELEENASRLQDEKVRLEEDYGHRRAKLKELYLQKEEELRLQTEQKASIETEVEVLRSQVQQLQGDLEEAHSAVTIAQCTAENDVAVEQRKCQEEIATVHQLMKEEVANAVDQTGGRYEGEIKRLKKLTERLDAEKQHYRRLYERQLEESDIRNKGESLLNPGVLSVVTKSLAKRVPSLSPSTLSTPEKASHNTSFGPQPSSLIVDSENLEDSMKKVRSPRSHEAQEDADLLRSLVEPLEEEIHALKEKIRAQDAQLRAHEAQQAAALHTADLVAPLLQGTDTAQVVQQLDDKLKGICSTLEAEKASRADLELYTAILNTQKTALTDEVDRLRSQMTELRQSYETERRQHRDLKHTWRRANDQFLEAQRLHLADMRRMQVLLTQDQLHKLEAQQSEEATARATPHFTLTNAKQSPTHMATHHIVKKHGPSPTPENEVESDKSSSLLDLEEEPTPTPATTTTTAIATTSQGEQSDDQSSETETRSLPPDSLAPDGLVPRNILAERFSPDKMPQLTQDQQRALQEVFPDAPGETPLTPQDEDYLVIDFSPSADARSGQGQGRRVVSEAEWNMLHEEIRRARSHMGRSCQLCTSYQSQLQKAQSDHKDTEKQRLDLERALQRYKEDLDREAQYRQVMEERWQGMAEDYEKKVAGLATVVETAAGKQMELETKFRSTISSVHDKLRSLTERREIAQQELTRLQKENDDLVGKHSKHSQQLQNEIINLPDNMEDMQLLLLRYQEDIIEAKVSKEHQEESLKSEILFLKDRVLAEQHEKNTIEDRLSSEIDQLREKVALLESLESQMKLERRTRVESDAQVRDLETKHAESQVKSQQIITGLKTQVAEQTQMRARLEAEVVELRGRVSTLQHDLDTSEAVQRDFVRLSQSLQVQLEKIRQSEKEVRWQHEEDQEECNSCKQRFSAMGRRKHHCRHCGKIFCNECVSKTVPSGPHRRPSRVCDVCHTLLVQDATPYFSSEPPHSPD